MPGKPVRKHVNGGSVSRYRGALQFRQMLSGEFREGPPPLTGGDDRGQCFAREAKIVAGVQEARPRYRLAARDGHLIQSGSPIPKALMVNRPLRAKAR